MTSPTADSRARYRPRNSDLEPCDEYVDIGPFRFECDGHYPYDIRAAVKYHGGKLAHRCSSPRDVGDVDVTFWTMVDLPPNGRSES